METNLISAANIRVAIISLISGIFFFYIKNYTLGFIFILISIIMVVLHLVFRKKKKGKILKHRRF